MKKKEEVRIEHSFDVRHEHSVWKAVNREDDKGKLDHPIRCLRCEKYVLNVLTPCEKEAA